MLHVWSSNHNTCIIYHNEVIIRTMVNNLSNVRTMA